MQLQPEQVSKKALQNHTIRNKIKPNMRQIFLDTETTGLSHREGDRVIEIGCIELINREPTDNNLHYYFNAGRDSHPDALRVHGISTDFLADKPRFEEKADEIADYLRGAEILIHNAAFDVGFLNAEFARLKKDSVEKIAGSITDTVALAKKRFPGGQVSLDALCRKLEVDNSARDLHGALLDARLLANVYLALTRVQNSLLEETGADGGGSIQRLDLSQHPVVVATISPQEADKHAAIMRDITG